MQVETLLAISTHQLQPASMEWLSAGGKGAILYPNEYGGFMFVGYPDCPDFDAVVPAEIARLAENAWRAGLMWIKFDPDGYQDIDWAAIGRTVVLTPSLS